MQRWAAAFEHMGRVLSQLGKTLPSAKLAAAMAEGPATAALNAAAAGGPAEGAAEEGEGPANGGGHQGQVRFDRGR